MTLLPPDRWPDVERLFEAVVAGPARRAALLAAADPAVAAEVRALLDAEPKAAAFFESPAPLAALLEAPLDDLVGARVGPWTVEAEIGRGGMGTVYRARRADGAYDQAVALKVVRRGMDSEAVVRRFRRERALLAALTHPSIARLVDGGTTPDGRPYLALDLVDGEPITAYADARRLPLAERLGLLLQVCDVVAHAHRQLVVHRDLKPSNVLVAEPDPGPGSAPRVALLDFGIARLLGADALDPLTRDGPGPLTPEYAAPEQLDGGPISTATDVYALGVLLYELLAGHRPHPAAERSPRAVRETMPTRPSLAATQARPRRSSTAEMRTVTPDEIAAARSLTPDRLRRRLRGDLDAICLKALRPEPAARYASVDALADDLRRHLDGQPVAARQGTVRYVAGKTLRRHWLPIGTAAFLVVLLAGSAVALAASGRRAARERDRAEAVASVLEQIILEADPGGRGGGPATVRDLLAAGATRASDLDDAPQAKARLLDVIARVYRALADYDRSLPLQREAVRLYAAARGPDDPETLRARHHLAYLLDQMGRSADAERVYREVLSTRRRQGNPDDLVESTSDLAVLLLRLDRPAEAAALAGEGLAVLRRHPDAGPSELEGPLSEAAFFSILGRARAASGQPADAERLLRRALALYVQERGPDHAYAAAAETRLASVLTQHGRFDEADRLLAHAAQVQEATWGSDHPWTLDALVARATAQTKAGRPRDAAALLATAERNALRAGDTTRASAIGRQAAHLRR